MKRLAVALAIAVAGPADAYTGSSTAYHPCDGSTSAMAWPGHYGHVGAVANNWLPFGTWIEMRRPRTVMGRRYFRVEDRGGGGFVLDFWAQSCTWMNRWERRTVTFRVVRRVHVGRKVQTRRSP